MKTPIQIKPPENWQDFETLCKKLWGEIWNCSDTIKKNGRSGQVQNGVDVYGAPDNGIEYYGIQCKGKDNYTKSQLTEKEIDTEIAKAQSFKPQLKRFYFATTAVKDAKIEEYIRLKNVESQTKDGFSIDVYSWEDIVDLLKENRNTYNWYINDCQYVDNSDVDIHFKSGDNTGIVYPAWLATSKGFIPKEEVPKNNRGYSFLDIGNYQTPQIEMSALIDYTWCEVELVIENIGNSIINNYIVTLEICSESEDSDVFIDDDSGSEAVIQGFSMRYRNVNIPTEVIVDKKTRVVEFSPVRTVLAQGQKQPFSFWIKGCGNINIKWSLKAADYSKDGGLLLKCEPKFEKKYREDNIIEGTSIDDLVIEPKIAKEI